MTPTTNAVVVREDYALSPQAEAERARFLPVMNMSMALERRDVIVTAIKRLMHAGEDYGAIPGAGKKMVLLQPGAQKLDNLFGLVPTYHIVDKELDFTGEKHAGEPFFHYEVRCILMRGEFQMGEGIGQCSSWESKYRWRKSERTCPQCGATAIIKGKAEYGGGWVCFARKGGCGAKFKEGDAAIVLQETGRVPNPDIHDQVNTILKMAEKRAHLLATINATSASEFFTQDIPPSEPRETQSEVADRRIAEEQERLEGQRRREKAGLTEVQPLDELPEVIQAWKFMSQGIKQTIEAFASTKADMIESMGSAGESEYYRILGKHGIKHANEFVKGPKANALAAQQCMKELWVSLRFAESMNVTQADVTEFGHGHGDPTDAI